MGKHLHGRKEMEFAWYRGDEYMGEGTIREMATQNNMSYARMCWLCTPSAQKVIKYEKQWYKFPVKDTGRATYAVYKGDKLLATGTAEEIAEQLGVKPRTVYFWSTDSTHRRNKGNRIIAFRIDDELEDEME